MINRRDQANRMNALKSTGPLTPEGKAASSQNNRKHGLAANIFEVLPTESQDDFEAYAAELEADFRPNTLLERTLVTRMAQHYWLAQRAIRAQNGCFLLPFGPVIENKVLMQSMSLYMRYQSLHDRAFHKCLAELQKLQAEKRREQIDTIRLEKAKAVPVKAKRWSPAIATTAPSATAAPANAATATEIAA